MIDHTSHILHQGGTILGLLCMLIVYQPSRPIASTPRCGTTAMLTTQHGILVVQALHCLQLSLQLTCAYLLTVIIAEALQGFYQPEKYCSMHRRRPTSCQNTNFNSTRIPATVPPNCSPNTNFYSTGAYVKLRYSTVPEANRQARIQPPPPTKCAATVHARGLVPDPLGFESISAFQKSLQRYVAFRTVPVAIPSQRPV